MITIDESIDETKIRVREREGLTKIHDMIPANSTIIHHNICRQQSKQTD